MATVRKIQEWLESREIEDVDIPCASVAIPNGTQQLSEIIAEAHAYMLEQAVPPDGAFFHDDLTEPASHPSATHREPVDKFSGLPKVTPAKEGIHIDTEYLNEPSAAQPEADEMGKIIERHIAEGDSCVCEPGIACTHHHKRSATWSPELDALAVLRNELEIESLMETIGLIVETPNVPHPAALQKLREWRDKWKR